MADSSYSPQTPYSPQTLTDACPDIPNMSGLTPYYSPQTFTDAYPDIPNASGSTRGGNSTFQSDAFGDTLPPTHKARTLVICFDSTGDQFGADVRVVADVCVDDLSLSKGSPLPPELEHRSILLYVEKGRF